MYTTYCPLVKNKEIITSHVNKSAINLWTVVWHIKKEKVTHSIEKLIKEGVE